MMHSIVKALVLIMYFLTFLGNTVFCQSNHNIIFNTINHTDGLPHNTVNAIVKDDLGFIWVGTNDGLCRYEASNNIKVFRGNDSKVEGGLESSSIRALFLDSKDNLWIGTRLGGLTKFHQPSDTWQTFRNDKNNSSSISSDEVLTITEDSKGRLWVGTEDGLNVFNYETESFVSFKADVNESGALSGKAVITVLEDDKGWIWVGTWAGGLNLLIPSIDGNLKNSRFRTFFPNKKTEAKHVWKIIEDDQNRYWVGTRGAGLFMMELPMQANNKLMDSNWQPIFHNYFDINDTNGIVGNRIGDIFQDSKDNLWVSTLDGLNCIYSDELSRKTKDPTSSKKPDFVFQHYSYESHDQTSITHNEVKTIFEDHQGLLWFGTFSGISVYNWFANQFDVYELDWASSTNAQNLYIDKQGVGWLSNGDQGIFKYDFQKQEKISFEKNEILLLNKFVSAIYSPDDKYLYIGTANGVSKLDMKTNQIKDYLLPTELREQIHHFYIRSFFKDQQNRIWIASDQGFFVIDERTGNYTAFKHDPNNPQSISDISIKDIKEDSNGNIWVATFNGLNKIKETASGGIEFERFKHDSSNPENSIPSNRISILEEVNGILYIGSSNGLGGYNLREKTFTNYSKDHKKYSIQSLEKTSDGNLWAGTTDGIIFFNTLTHAFNQYEKEDGLGDIIFQTGSSHRDKNGVLYFGSRQGITRFNPQSLLKNDVPPEVYVTDVRTMSPDGENRTSGIYTEEIILEHNDYYLSLDYAALNYNRSEKNKFAFMLEGFDDNWNYSDEKSPAVYTNLKHGSYNFRVKAANNDGVWNEEGLVLKVIKKPAFWETWWFRLGSLLFVITMLYQGMKSHTKNIKEKNIVLQKYNEDLNREITHRKKAEKELQEREQNLQESNMNLQRSNKDLEQFAYIASHDLQEPLRVVGSFIGLLRRRYHQHFDEEAFQYIDFAIDGVTRMSQQIKSILDFSRVSQKDIEFKLVNMDNVVFTKLHDLSQNIKEKNVQITANKLPDIVCEKNQIEMVFHNLICNAIKFNKKESPVVIISNNEIASDEFWQFSVEDNGIGIAKEYQSKIFKIFRRLHSKKDYEGTGIGLALSQKIVHRHGGKIWVESIEGEGTTFYFTISKNLKAKKAIENQKELIKALYN
ncbi:MAG: two-component regulator propeller domain-containing protein [Saprospiraceae bacterium]